MSVFYEDVQNSIILHIPHSGLLIPYGVKNYDEISKSTDFFTDEIFSLNYTTLKFPYSRSFCDVERFGKDSMDSIGRGFYYVKDYNGNVFRDEEFKKDVYENYYIPYHKELERAVELKLIENDLAIIIDCHSFNKERLPFEKEGERPDICIGTDAFHTPDHLVKTALHHFRNYSVKIDEPYSGAIVPLRYYQKDKRVSSIMIEINKRLYETDTINSILKLNKLMDEFISNII